jgi:serine/threonine protein kinase/tetratricopeptide (TPR) repeat protein
MTAKCPKCQAENPDTKSFCGDCGTQLVPQSNDIHPRLTETLQAPILDLAMGSTFANRYQVIEELGKGGMGKVYKVFDREVQAKMALKLIRPEVSADKTTIDRFRNELKIARDISHKNICRMYDLGRDAGNYFITMEYVSGEDLKSFIRRSKQLVVGTAIFIAKQVCEGLAEAHRLGVVHRDLKPGNIMIDKEGNAKIMDFGIARSVSAKGITGTGVMIGTPEYMSPEQVEGKEVDQRSDIYSLGIILYEMLTGQVPFEGDTPFTIGVKQRSEVPKDPQKVNAQIPDDLSRLILRCLEKDKEKRYQSADELRTEFEKIEKGVSTYERPAPKRKTITSRPITLTVSRKKLFIPASVIILVTLVAIIWIVLLRRAAPRLPQQRRSIAIISFENQTGNPAYDYLSKVIPNLLITKLEQSGSFDVTTWERLRDLLKQVGKGDVEFIDPDLGFEVCQKEGVEHIVLGLLSMSGNTFVTDAKVLDVATKKLLGTANSRGDGPDSILKSQVDDLSRQIARGAGLSERKALVEGKRIGDLTTRSLEAYDFYLKGLEEKDKWRLPQARQYFEKAVDLDPDFVMALRELGAKSLEKAMALSKNVTEKERLYTEASYALSIEKNSQKAIKLYRQMVDKYPKEKMAYEKLGSILEPREALEMFQRALELDPKSGTALNYLGYSLLAMNQPEQAVDVFKKYASLRPGDVNALDSLADAHFQLGQLDEAVENYQKAVDIDPSWTNSMLGIGYIFALREDYSQASGWMDKAIDNSLGGEKPCAYVWKSFLLFWQGNIKGSLRHIQTAEDISRALNFEGSRAHADWLRAWIFYDQGEFELSRRYSQNSRLLLIKAIPDLESFSRAGHDFLEGLIDLREGNVESARSRLAELDSLIKAVPQWDHPSLRENEMAVFEAEWLRSAIQLCEKPFDKATASLKKSAAVEFVPAWTPPDYHKLRYNTPFQRDSLARGYIEHGETDKAIAEYERLIAFDPTKPARLLIHPLYHYRLGVLYEQKGVKDKARGQYERFLEFWKDADSGRPEPADARKRLAALEKNRP